MGAVGTLGWVDCRGGVNHTRLPPAIPGAVQTAGLANGLILPWGNPFWVPDGDPARGALCCGSSGAVLAETFAQKHRLGRFLRTITGICRAARELPRTAQWNIPDGIDGTQKSESLLAEYVQTPERQDLDGNTSVDRTAPDCRVEPNLLARWGHLELLLFHHRIG